MEQETEKKYQSYWRSSEVELVESDNAELSACESGGDLPEDTAMHYLLEEGILKIHFCESGAMINVKSNDKHLTLEIPKDIDLSVHTTSAPVKADTLEQNSILISAHSGKTELGTAEAESISLSSSSGTIRADRISAQTLKCDASSGSVQIKNLEADMTDIETTSGCVDLTLTSAPDVKIDTSSGNSVMQNRSFFCGFKCCQIHLTPYFQRSKTGLIDRKRKSDYSQGRSREQITYEGGYFMELNAQIKKYRKSLNLSQEELAEKVYVTRQTISNWENGAWTS